MSVDINLAQVDTAEQKKAEKVKKIKAVSVAVLIITAFMAVIIFAIDYRFSASYVQKQENELLQELEAKTEISSKIFIVNSKLSGISQIIEERRNLSGKSEKLLIDFPDSIEIEDYIIDEDGVVMTIITPSLTDLDDYLNYLIDLSDEKEFNAIKLEKLEFNRGEYEAEIIIT